MLIVILVGWLPLLLLSAGQSVLTQTDTVTSFLREIGAHARYLVAAPLLIFAEAAAAPHLSEVIRHFDRSGLVDAAERRTFVAAVDSTRSLLTSRAAEAAIAACTVLTAIAVALSYKPEDLPPWAMPLVFMPYFSAAGWWHTLVSLPVLLLLLLGWLWRLLLWSRLLWQISRLHLHLVPSHPDHCAGLCFLGHSVRAFSIIGLALAVIVAGRSAHDALAGTGLPTPHLYFNAGFLTAVAALFVAPLLVFIGPLFETWRKGTLSYDALATRVGDQFEREWLPAPATDSEALERPDFSATTDLYSIVANVHGMRFVPLDLKDLVALAAALLLPFLPVLFLSIPLDVIGRQLKNLLL